MGAPSADGRAMSDFRAGERRDMVGQSGVVSVRSRGGSQGRAQAAEQCR